MLHRTLELPPKPKESFFLWGPRQSGKSTLLKQTYPQAVRYDLLNTDVYVRLLHRPSLLRQQLLFSQPKAGKTLVLIDEIQKVPLLLDEVHWLIENTNYVFGLCGSSARKLRRGHANLLGGRAIRYELYGLISAELGKKFDLTRMLNQGYFPRHYLSQSYKPLLRSYVSDYLAEEIATESLVRNLPAFTDFLRAAALSDTELVNYTNIARECGVSSKAVKEYFQIMIDTLLAAYLQPYTKRPKRRVIQAPKFYFADVGVVNHLAQRGELAPGSELFGKAFENWVFHELKSHRAYSELYYDLYYWRLAGGTEVDFIVNDMEIAIEAKSSARITKDHLRGLRTIVEDHPKLKRRIVVSLEDRGRQTDDGIEIFPYKTFIQHLWAGKLIN